MKSIVRHVIAAAAGVALAGGFAGAADAQQPKRGGVIPFVVPAEPPSFDGHRETTFALIHPIAPFYSTLIRVNPDNPSATDEFVCDVCEAMPPAEKQGKRYTFKIRKDVKFHNGEPMTAHDVVASFQRIVFPPADVSSARKSYFEMVESIKAPDAHTVVFELKHPSGAFIPAVATPYNFIYQKSVLDKDQHWYEKNVLGSGPFIFEERQAGAFIKGKRNPNYHLKGQPYLDGFEAIFADKEAVRVQAIRGNRAMIEFRGFPPKSRDLLVEALGKDITVQESDWNCVLLVTPNHEKKPFDDVRVRKALTLSLDRWGGSKHLSQIAIVKTVGGVVFPGHRLAATKPELEKLAGYWPDIDKSRAEAKRLLKEAGIPDGFKFSLLNRGVDQPYKIVGTWLIDQWRQVGLTVEQRVQPTGPFYDTLRSKRDFDVTVEFNCQSIVNPLLDVSKFLSKDRSEANYGGYIDRKVDEAFDRMNRSGDPEIQRAAMREFERLIVDEHANQFVTLWWYRIIPHRSVVKGWKISPSHYLNQDLANVWLDQ